MSPNTAVAVNHSFDDATLAEILDLREMRLELATKQLQDADETIGELIRRNLIPAGDREVYLEELKTELSEKVKVLSERIAMPHIVHFDEIELYVNVLDGVSEN